MSKSKTGIEKSLGLPSIEELKQIVTDEDLYNIELDDEEIEEEIGADDIAKARASMTQLKQYREQLKDIPDITSRKAHLDRLAELAERKFEDIFDRGFNCEDRFMAEIIRAANDMLKLAMDAHSKVIDSDIKLIDMQIKKDKIEIELNMKPKKPQLQGEDNSNAIEGETTTRMTRNDLLAKRNMNK